MNIGEKLSSALQGKLDQLKSLPYCALQALPKSTQESIPGVKGGGLNTWIEEQADQSLKVSVLASKNYFLGLGTSQVGGFRVSRDGAVVYLKPNKLE